MHPLKFIHDRYYNRIIFVTLILSVFVMIGLQWSEFPLQNSIAPKGIVSFELAGDLEKANLIVSSWNRANVLPMAGFNIGLDYLFLLLYPVLIAAVIVVIAEGLKERILISRAGYVVSWVVIFAGVLDGFENAFLINILMGTNDPSLPVLAYYFATSKFIIVGLGIGYIIVGGITRVIHRTITAD